MTKLILNDLILFKKILKSRQNKDQNLSNNNNNNNDNNNNNNEPIEVNSYNLIEECITIKDDNRDVLCWLETK